jgi:hypothetical protein
MDPATLAATATAAALPYLLSLGKDVAKGAAGEAGKNIWNWIKSKLASPAGLEATSDLEKFPSDPDNKKACEAALSKLLRSDAGALTELAQLLSVAGVRAGDQTANIVGDNNIVNQASGSNITR